jgi:hypothetical protein
MKLYARSDVTSVATPAGHTHKRKVVEKAKRNTEAVYAEEFFVDCPDCEEYLIDTGDFTKDAPKKTPDEIKAEMEDDRQADLFLKNEGRRKLADAREAARAAI